MEYKTDVLIIGAGPAGIFAAFQAGMLGMSCHVVDILPMAGGQCTELYPQKPIYDVAGFPQILAKDLIANLIAQAAPFNPVYHFNSQVIGLKKIHGNFQAFTSNALTINAKVVVIASGNGSFVPNKPLVHNIANFENRSVYYSVSDIEKFRDKKILIAGGGDSAIDWAMMLQNIAGKVYLVHRREKFRCHQDNFNKLSQLAKTHKIEILVPYQMLEINGQDGIMDHVLLQNFTNQEQTKLHVDYLLAFFGLKMDLGPIADWGLALENGKIKVNSSDCQTNIDGIYAIGDIATYQGKLKLIVTGFAEAASALHHCYTKVFDGKQLHFEYSTNKGIPNS